MWRCVNNGFFFGRRHLPFGWSPTLKLTCGPAGNRITTGSLSALSKDTALPISPQGRLRCVNNGSSVLIFEAIEHVFEPSCFAPLFAFVRRLVALIPLTVVVQHDPSNACSVSLLQLLGFFSVSNFAFKYVSGCVRHFPSTVSTFYTLSNCHELPIVPFTPLQVSIDSQLRDLEDRKVRQCPAMRLELLIQRHV